MTKLSTTLSILAQAESIMAIGENTRETRIILPSAEVVSNTVIQSVSRAYAVLAV